MDSKPTLRSNMRKARGLGASGHGTKHWWLQRVTAVALVPLSVWFVVHLLNAMMFPTPELVYEFLESPINALALGLLILAMFVHAYLGIQVIIEDYIKTPFFKFSCLMLNYFVCFAFAVICILSILRMHLNAGV